MSVFIVNYDLNKEVNRPHIVKKLKETYPNWARLSESSYAIQTSQSAQQVYNTFAPLLDNNDQLYVITLSAPWWGQDH